MRVVHSLCGLNYCRCASLLPYASWSRPSVTWHCRVARKPQLTEGAQHGTLSPLWTCPKQLEKHFVEPFIVMRIVKVCVLALPTWVVRSAHIQVRTGVSVPLLPLTLSVHASTAPSQQPPLSLMA